MLRLHATRSAITLQTPEGPSETTRAVVKSIFLVVLADLMATAFFYLFWQ